MLELSLRNAASCWHKPVVRIQHTSTSWSGAWKQGDSMAERDVKPTDAYADKVLKLLPAEVTAAYLAIRSVIDLTSAGQQLDPSDLNKLPAYIIFGVIVFLTIA